MTDPNQPYLKDSKAISKKQPRIDWKKLTDKNLYLLQYYGKTDAIRNRAKAELLKRA